MAISYPLTPPAALKVASISITPKTVVASATSPFTLQQQVYVHPGQRWQAEVHLPPMKRANAEDVIAFLLALNGPQGTFYLGDSANRLARGTIAGTVTVGASAVANSTTLPISGGTGAFALGDWLQVGTTTAAKLHKVIKVNAGSVDVFPRLRSAYASGTAITYSSPVGLFRLPSTEMPWTIDESKIYHIGFAAVEDIE